MTRQNLKAELDALITDGVAINVFQAEEALRLEELIGRVAPRLNEAGFGPLFGPLQVILGRYVILHAAQLFEEPGARYPIQSMPAAIAFLREHANDLAIEQRSGLLRSLARLGASIPAIEHSADSELTHFVADFFAEQISRIDAAKESGDTSALSALKTLRDKVVAHREAVLLNDLPKPTYVDIDRIVALARSFVGAVAFGYLTVGYEDDRGDSSISHDAQRATTSLRKLLERAGTLPLERNSA